MKTSRNKAWLLLLLSLGYLGTAGSYSYLIGVPVQFAIACPVCPNLDGIGNPIDKFTSRILLLGTLNALLFLALGGLVLSLLTFSRRTRPKRPRL
jgi:hypothetical protein